MTETTMPALRPELPELPRRIRRLPVDARGYPVPWFVLWVDGKPEFRVMDRQKLMQAVQHRLCWVCGDILGQYLAFTVGPMCTVNRLSAEPPGHRECAEFSARACPFLTRPHMHRRENALPDGTTEPPGLALLGNPGVTAVWVTHQYTPEAAGDGVLFRMGEPDSVTWFCQGRPAARSEVLEAMARGIVNLEAAAKAEDEAAAEHPERPIFPGSGRISAAAALNAAYMAAMTHLPRD